MPVNSEGGIYHLYYNQTSAKEHPGGGIIGFWPSVNLGELASCRKAGICYSRLNLWIEQIKLDSNGRV